MSDHRTMNLDGTALTPQVMRALGARLSDIIDDFGIKKPEDRLQVLCAMLYGEATQARLSLRELVEFASYIWGEQSKIVESQVEAHRLAQAAGKGH